MFARTGLLAWRAPDDVPALLARAAEHLSPALFSEAFPTVGRGVVADEQEEDGLLLIGPFHCLPFRISEAILRPLCLRQGLPILTYESDGGAVSPAFHRMVDVHIQQVLRRRAEREAREGSR